ncbi:BEN domain-containing 5 [Labeo rohita]|uniref:BEN domain-containing protein 5 n=6 Tax=Cyprinidae TaxID=7953 RepID=A0A498NRB2_LABRO|nr:BEN domain-containing 5 [Labeo rohita]
MGAWVSAECSCHSVIQNSTFKATEANPPVQLRVRKRRESRGSETDVASYSITIDTIGKSHLFPHTANDRGRTSHLHTAGAIRQRLPAKNVYYYRCPDHRRNYVMSFAFCFDREDDIYQFAYCYPYTYSRLQHYLASLERRNLDYLQREQLGLSVLDGVYEEPKWMVLNAIASFCPKEHNSGPKHNLDSCTSQQPIPAPVRSAFNGAEGPGLAQKGREQRGDVVQNSGKNGRFGARRLVLYLVSQRRRSRTHAHLDERLSVSPIGTGKLSSPIPKSRDQRAKIMYAFVRFLEDDMCYALPVSDVKDFQPVHKRDFDDQKVYVVLRGAGQPAKAHILALAESIEEFEHSIMQKKMKIPKMSNRNTVENHFGEERMPLRHKKVQSQEQQRASSNSSKSLAAVVARLERNAVNSCTEGEELDRLTTEEEEEQDEAVVPRVLYEELVHSYRQQEEEMRRLQQELERTRRQLLQQAKKLKEYGSLLTEVKELRDFNRRLQDVLLMRLGSEPMHDNGTQTIKAEVVEPISEPQEVCQEEANTSSTHSPSPRTVYTFNDGKVHLGGGIWVEEEKWHQLQRTQGDSKFTKNLAVMIWGTETLKNRSVTGVATKKKKDALPKPPLSPSKLKIVRECLYDRVSQETADSAEITQRLSKVNKYICEKIMDINKSIKNEERRESKLLIQQTVKMENFPYDGL